MGPSVARLESQGLSVKRGQTPVLRDVALTARRGELLGLIGPNGGGKTTLLLALAGLIDPAGGRVTLDGAPVAAMPADQRARLIGYLEQDPQVHWPITVERVAMLGRFPHRRALSSETDADRAAVDAALHRCDLLDLRNRPVDRLSGGERARVMLARLLAGEPAVLLTDEPVAALDPRHQLTVMRLLKTLATEGRIVVVILHDLSLALRYCDRVCLIDAGQVAAEGPPGDVIANGAAERVFGVSLHHGDGWAIPWATVGKDKG